MKLFFIIFILIFTSAPFAKAAVVATVSSTNPSTELFDEIKVLDNRNFRFNWNQIQVGAADRFFETPNSWPLFLGIITDPQSGDFWLKIPVDNQLTNEVAFVIHHTTTANIERVYFKSDGQQTFQAVYTRPEKLQRTRKTVPIPPGKGLLYLELRPDLISLPIMFFQLSTYPSLMSVDPLKVALGLSYGVSLALLLYNVIFTFIFRTKSHLLYVLYNIGILFYYEGRYQYFAENELFFEIPINATIFINSISSLLYFRFLCEIMNIRTTLKSWLPVQTAMTYFLLILSLYSFINPLRSQIILLQLLIASAPFTLAITAHAVYLKVPDSKLLIFTALLPGIGSALHLGPSTFGKFFSLSFYDVIQMACFSLEMILLSMTVGSKISRERLALQNSIKMAYQELQTIVYPHQVEMIKDGKTLNQTMPVGSSKAFVLVFDVVGSSKIDSTVARTLLPRVFQECYKIMVENYNGKDLSANAFRVKEVGDGFICSIGFPFTCPHPSAASHSILLATKFRETFRTLVAKILKEQNLYCAIGIAYDSVEGYYPESGPQVYDLFGRGIVLATRYESMRNVLFSKLGLKGSVIIIQDSVFKQLAPEEKSLFTQVHLPSAQMSVRDDESAEFIYFNISASSSLLRQSS